MTCGLRQQEKCGFRIHTSIAGSVLVRVFALHRIADSLDAVASNQPTNQLTVDCRTLSYVACWTWTKKKR